MFTTTVSTKAGHATMNANLSQEDLRKLVHALAWNDDFGCYTRPGFEKLVWPDIAERARWILYFDVDGMHHLNAAYGDYGPVDAMLKDVLAVVRETDYVAGQWKSGDEFLICITETEGRLTLDPHGMIGRLTEELKKHGMSATFALVPVMSLDLAENVKPAVERVYAIKNQRGAGR